VAKWQAADSTTAIPALHYIAVTHREHLEETTCTMRMPFKQIDTVLKWAKPIDALVYPSGGTVKTEVTELVKYLSLPQVHLGILNSLKNGHVPGTKIGSFTAGDINDAIDILAKVVRENKLPPKCLSYTGLPKE
jgi:hypothetical protein